MTDKRKKLPTGYRAVRVGRTVRDKDKVWDWNTNRWRNTRCVNDIVCCAKTYYRKAAK